MPQSLLFVAFLALGYGCLGPVDKLAYQLLRITPGQFAIWSSHAGDMLAYLTALATVLYLRRQPQRLGGFLLLLAGQHVLTHGSKWFFQTLRPQQIGLIEGYAYPSGHTMTAACIYGYLAYRTRGPARAILLALPLLVAWSRVALGHHWLSDVIGSLLLARLWLSLCPRLIRRWNYGQKRKGHLHALQSALKNTAARALDQMPIEPKPLIPAQLAIQRARQQLLEDETVETLHSL